MTDNWKNVERNVAKLLNGKRVPLSGGNNTFANGGDVEHSLYFIEVKQRKTLAIADWYEKTVSDCKKHKQEHKLPLLILHKHNKKKYLAVTELEFFQEYMWLVESIKTLDKDVQLQIRQMMDSKEREHNEVVEKYETI